MKSGAEYHIYDIYHIISIVVVEVFRLLSQLYTPFMKPYRRQHFFHLQTWFSLKPKRYTSIGFKLSP